MLGDSKTVSVVVPCFNQGQFLAAAIESVLAQTYPHVELIVVDDGSSDSTPEVAGCYASYVRYLRKENAGLSAARNTGILAATGRFVLFLDADDRLTPDALHHHMQAAAAFPQGTVYHSSWQDVNEGGGAVSVTQASPLPADTFHALLARNRFVCHAAMVRRTALANVGLFDVNLCACEDWDLWIRLAAAGAQFVAVPDAVVTYRRYPASMSTDYQRMWAAGLAVLRKNQTHHHNCALCRQSHRSARRWWDEWCLPLLVQELRSDWSGNRWRQTAALVQGATRSPALVRMLFGRIAHRTWRMARAPQRSRVVGQ